MLAPVLACFVLGVAPPAPKLEVDGASLSEADQRYHRRRTNLGLGGMGTLTAWSVVNIAGGLAGSFTPTGELRFFHQGNAAWNSVNLVLGVVGLVGQRRDRRAPVDLATGAARGEKAQLALLINTGLDVVYVGAGVALWAGVRGPADSVGPRLRGYGQALVLQGSFLFAFDVAMAWAHHALLEDALGSRSRAQVWPMITPEFGVGEAGGVGLRGLRAGVGLRF